MAAQLDDSLGSTHWINLLEIAKFLEETASQDEADFAATGDEQKRLDAVEKRTRASTIRALLALRVSGAD